MSYFLVLFVERNATLLHAADSLGIVAKYFSAVPGKKCSVEDNSSNH